MTYQPHALLKFGGRWFSTEEWSCGLRIITSDDTNELDFWVDAAEVFLEDVVPMVAAWFIDTQSNISMKARLDYVALNAIGPEGLYADPGNPHEHVYTDAAAPTGSNGSYTWPQLTTCVSLRTAVARGRGTHGRVYTPTAFAPGDTGRLSSTQRTDVANEFRDLLQDISTIESLPLAGFPRVAVVSKLGDPGPARIVTHVMVGDVLDTQRRRRNQLPEVYSDVAVVT
jgi:hypothetical protein